jgi:putative addiction module antidote
MYELKVTRVGNSLGVILPKEAAARLKVEAGDTLYVHETAEGYQLTPYDPGFGEQMEAARRVMKRRRNALHELAK